MINEAKHTEYYSQIRKYEKSIAQKETDGWKYSKSSHWMTKINRCGTWIKWE